MNEQHKIPCSVGILTFNNERTLQRCLDSVALFDDVVICDGGSTDTTISIAQKYGCRVIEQDLQFKRKDNTIADFSGVRNQQLKYAKYDWFVFIDSDEYLSTEVVEEIRGIVVSDQSTPSIFKMPRKYVKNGIIIDCATTYPNYQVRFFNKRAILGFVRAVHEKIEPKEGFLVSKLQQCEYVPLDDVDVLKQKWVKYLSIEKESNTGDSIWEWLRSGLLKHLKVSLLYVFRYMKILFFCKGKRMPFAYEKLRIWYNMEVIKVGFVHVLRGYKKK